MAKKPSSETVSGHFKAEDSGVWEKDIAWTQLSVEAEANLKGQVEAMAAFLR